MSFQEFGPIISARSPALRSALSALDGFDAAKAARAAVSQRMGVLSTSEQAEQVLLDRVLDALRAGQPLSADLGAESVNARAGDQRLVAERMLLTRAVEQLEGRGRGAAAG
ncbi:MAG: hypothetical protein H0T66_14380 [Geodermatophilaceae bacterium]|nr:hypothetical protein [Geodermatophilaceae bacterium]